jgi:transcriptional regulator with XRE-family HTH domain
MSNNLTDKLGNFLVAPAQSRGARGMLGWSQDQLAEAAKISRATIADFERGERTPTVANLIAIREAFEKAGLEFIPENGGGVGLRFKQPGTTRT